MKRSMPPPSPRPSSPLLSCSFSPLLKRKLLCGSDPRSADGGERGAGAGGGHGRTIGQRSHARPTDRARSVGRSVGRADDRDRRNATNSSCLFVLLAAQQSFPPTDFQARAGRQLNTAAHTFVKDNYKYDVDSPYWQNKVPHS